MRHASIPTPLLALARRQEGLVSTRQCARTGLDKGRRRRLVASGRAAVPTFGVVDLSPLLTETGRPLGEGPVDLRRRSACLALLAHGPHATAVGACALALLGVQGLPRAIRPEVMLPARSGRRRRDGIVVRRFDDSMPTLELGEFSVAAPTWALAQAICELDRDHAVAVLDSALQHRWIPHSELGEVRRLTRGRRGAARLRSWWELVDGRAQSPLETRARLRCVDAGIAPDDLQVPVLDARGRVIARGDLGWRLSRGRWLVAEIDGAGPHGTPEAIYADRIRQNAVVATGMVDMLRFTAADLPARLVPTVAAHLALDRANAL